MNRASALVRHGLLAAGGFLGLLGAHALNYRLLIGDPRQRQEILLSTGHGWLPAIESVAVACALAAVTGALLSHFGSGERAGGFRALTARLAATQSVAFLTLEFGERIFAGAPLHHLTPALLAAGLILQILSALGVAGALTLLGRAGARLTAAFRRAPSRPRPTLRSLPVPDTHIPFARRVILAAADPVRGPPVSSAA